MRPAPLVLLALAPLASAQELADDPPPPPPVWEEILRLRARLEALERAQGSAPSAQEPYAIDLSGEPAAELALNGEHVLARPWFENVRLFGYAALNYLDTGGTGTTHDGSFLIKEASLFLEAEVWERTRLFTEIWLTRYQFGSGFNLGELNLQFSDLFARDGEEGIGLRLGRFEIPFGEEYLRWDADETPMISFTAADPYGIDEGVELFGALRGLNWIAAVTNGSNGTGVDDGAAKQLVGKLHGRPWRDLYLSASVLDTGSTESSALRFGGSTLAPVGAGGVSTAGTSPSDDVDSLCWELDARVAEQRTASLNLSFGRGRVDDEVDAFDRGLLWFLVEPALRLRDDLELVLRWSEIGTYDDDEGYRFAGMIIADGEVFGNDPQVLRRVSGGLCWTVHPNLRVKLEVGKDHIDLIDASPLDADNDERLFVACEVVGSF